MGAVESIALLIASYTVFTWSWRELAGSLATIATSWNDLRVFVFIFESILLAGLLKEKQVLDKLVNSMGILGCRFSFAAVPAVVGLLPMPGGALVSAIAMRKRYLEEARLSPEAATYINYWFRHVWVPSWPLFQSAVITATIFAVDPVELVRHTWPASIAAIAAGGLIAYIITRHASCPRSRARIQDLVASISPFLAIALLVFSLGIPLLLSLTLVLAATITVLRPNRKEFMAALKLATKPRIHAVLLEALMFKNLLLATNAPGELLSMLLERELPIEAIVYLLPFIVGLSAGGENFFAAVAMPLLASVIASSGAIDWKLMIIAYTGGHMGVMASPVHLCLALTVEYYEAKLGKTLAYTLASIAVATALLAAILALTRLY
ncbi:conserved archaeal protein [Hyperthermus butylicus DSM 5456]|uniref:Conserved archaeal protein n=1 Tax=Hyperthermus butylicus (strain DSM 5456 / JCM 9403 / PLM1-5) TaxID=415426 RepID=A2BKY1_HYPBU|nr:conserved archaeal protein [Hyperthermus butylicus DSM 5456]